MARHHERHSQAGGDVGLSIGIGRLPGVPVRRAELEDGTADVPEVAQNDTRGLVSYRRLGCGRSAGEYLPRNRQGISGPGECERKQFVRVHGANLPSPCPDTFRS